MSNIFNIGNEIESPFPKKMKKSIGILGRLIIGFSLVTIFFLIAIGINWSAVEITKKYAIQVSKVEFPTYDEFIDLNSEIYLTQLVAQRMILTNDVKLVDRLINSWNNIDKIVSMIDELSKSWTNNSYQKRWDELKNLLEKLKIGQYKIAIPSTYSNKPLAMNILISEVRPLVDQISKLLNTNRTGSQDAEKGFLDLQSQQLTTATQKILESLRFVQLTEYILSIFGVITSIFIAFMTARAVLRHINIFRQHSSRIASGDLTRFIQIESMDEMGLLGNDLNAMTKSLATIATEITQSCHSMVSTLEEVQHAVDTQSSGASEQASSINEITVSLSEIEKSSAQTLEKAKSLGESAERTREKGQLGLDAVDQSVNGMNEVREKVQIIAQTILDLSHQTQQVGEITSVVNNLAQQSKMLALNASIEAAKAGEAGKGFAVVAVEVKNLAEQSEQATTQVQKILENIRHAAEKAVMVTEEGTKGVDYGMDLVEQTGEVIRNLNEVIHETMIASQQIESAVRQESAGIEQITTGMNEINQVTTSFVESVKQTTEAIGNLAVIAKNLKAYVDMYKL